MPGGSTVRLASSPAARAVYIARDLSLRERRASCRYARIQGRGVLVPPEDPRAAAWALSRVLGGERPDPVPGRAYARQFTPSVAAAVCAGAYRRLLASRATSGEPTGPQP
jgi:hypothetical protein